MQSVCAVIVTFNRKQELRACLASLMRAERTPETLIVVDNASTDGTPDFVRHEFPDVQLIRLPANTGGAGGFKAGITAALQSGHGFIWLMDDDHTAEPGTLARLLETAERTPGDAFGPVLLSPDNSDMLTTSYFARGRVCRSYSELTSALGSDTLIRQFPTPFNGVLYRSDALRTLGLPDARLFIRGDDLDYWLRMQEEGLDAVVVSTARMHHPSMFHHDFVILRAAGFILTAHYTGENLKDYCLFRNRAYCFKKYRSYRILGLDVLRYILFFVITRRADFRGLFFWARAYVHGLIGRFGYERRFLAIQPLPG